MFHSYETDIEVDGQLTKVILADTQDGPDHQELRQRVCKGSDVVFLCFSVIQPDSLRAVRSKWREELRSCERPIILLATKIDMRDNEELRMRLAQKNMKPLSQEEGQKVAQEIGALGFYETSCKWEVDPLIRVFQEGLTMVFGPPKTITSTTTKQQKAKAGKKNNSNSNNLGNNNVVEEGGAASPRTKNCSMM